MAVYINGVFIPKGFKRWYAKKLKKAGFVAEDGIFQFITYQLRKMSPSALRRLVREYQKTHKRYYVQRYK